MIESHERAVDVVEDAVMRASGNRLLDPRAYAEEVVASLGIQYHGSSVDECSHGCTLYRITSLEGKPND